MYIAVLAVNDSAEAVAANDWVKPIRLNLCFRHWFATKTAGFHLAHISTDHLIVWLTYEFGKYAVTVAKVSYH